MAAQGALEGGSHITDDVSTRTCVRVEALLSDRHSGMRRSDKASKPGTQQALLLGWVDSQPRDKSLAHAATRS